MKELSFLKLSLIVLIFMLLLPAFSFSGNDTLTFNDIYRNRKLYPKGVRGLHSMSNGRTYCVLENDSVNIYAVNAA